MHIDKQLELFEHYQQRLSAHIGAEEAKKLVNKALALIILGGNDFVNNYYWVPFSARFYQFSLPDYVTYLISEFKIFLKVIFLPFQIIRRFVISHISRNVINFLSEKYFDLFYKIVLNKWYWKYKLNN